MSYYLCIFQIEDKTEADVSVVEDPSEAYVDSYIILRFLFTLIKIDQVLLEWSFHVYDDSDVAYITSQAIPQAYWWTLPETSSSYMLIYYGRLLWSKAQKRSLKEIAL